MRASSYSIIGTCVALLAASIPVQGRMLEIKVAHIGTGAGTLDGVHATLDWQPGDVTGKLRVRASGLDFPALSYRARNVDWQCQARRDSGGRWRCHGPVSVRGSKARQLALDYSADAILATLTAGRSALTYRHSANAPDLHAVGLRNAPVAWLQPFLAGLWAQGRWTAGTLGGTVAVVVPDKGPFAVKANLDVAGLNVETPDGLIAAEALRGRLKVDYRQSGALRETDARVTLRGGEFLAGSLYARLPATAVEAHVAVRQQGSRAMQLTAIEWRDPGVLEASGRAGLSAEGDIDSLDAKVDIGSLAVARDRYLGGFLAPAGFSEVLLSGAVAGTLQMRDAGFTRVEARVSGVNAVDPKARFTFAGIDGRLAWTRDATPVHGTMDWQSGALFGIGLGRASFPLTSANGSLSLDSAVSVAALDGKLRLDHLHWQAPTGEKSARVVFGLGIDAMDLGSLAQRLGWPEFTGSISGRIPSARLENDVLVMDGGVQVDVFGGHVNVRRLAMERPFGVAPTLSADVGIEDLDLDAMTRVFGFGSITGRLDGRIDNLRLVDWSTQEFEAELHTDTAWQGKRRISQRAINDISSVGGGGLGSGLQAQALKFFDDFGYRRIGISCKLKDTVCAMDGIGSAGDGYIIVEGAGLPRIQVVGFRRRVDWPTLVARLQAATSGQAPIIN